MFKWQAIDLQT